MPRPPLTVLTPIAPRRSGNGLAMRAARFQAAAAGDFEPLPVVVPVAGVLGGPAPSGLTEPAVVVLEPPGDLRSGSLALLADPVWRRRLGEAQPLPERARVASPGWVRTVTRQILAAAPSAAGAPLHVMRSYLAPLGLAVAEGLDAPWVTLDLDDDDVSFETARGRKAEAEAFDRLLRVFAPHFSAVAAASPTDASSLARRYGFPVETIPNTVEIPSVPLVERPGRGGLLLIGNMTYEPNIEAALTLAANVLPRLRELTGAPVTLALVGAYEPHGPLAPLADDPAVRLTGAVADVAPFYAQAAVVVAPLPPGGGTKIKILEAFAHGVPVVTTPPGRAGLEVSDGVQLLIGTDPEQLALRASELLLDPGLARRLARSAFQYVRDHHAPAVADRAIGGFLAGAARSRRSTALS